MTKAIPVERKQEILTRIRERQFVSLKDLSEMLAVSPATVRRDLMRLESKGFLTRVHGGAVIRGNAIAEAILSLSERRTRFHEEKEWIGRKAASLLEDGDTVFMDGGTTTLEVALNLVNRNVQIVTNSLAIANLLSRSISAQVVLVGGMVHARAGVCLGPPADGMVRGMWADRAILGCGGVIPEGIMNTDILSVGIARQMAQNSDQVIVVADRSKWCRKSTCPEIPLSDVDMVVSDAPPEDPGLRKTLQDNSVRVITRK